MAARRLEGIDVLRGMAALMVTLLHIRGDLWVGWNQYKSQGPVQFPADLIAVLTLPLRFGWIGVPLFFVLSGYCIHRKQAQQRYLDGTERLDWREYWWRRLVRIYPVYLGALLLTLVLDTLFGDPEGLGVLAGNLLTLQGLLVDSYGSNSVLWTLSLEIHLYALYPCVLWAFRKFGVSTGAVYICLTSGAYLSLHALLGFNDYLPFRADGNPIVFAHWAGWCLGCVLAEEEAGRVKIPSWVIAGLSMTILAVLACDLLKVLDWPMWFGGLAMVVPVRIAIRRDWFAHRFRWFVPLGFISYSLYATHRPILNAIRLQLLVNKSRSLNPTFIVAAFCIVCSIVFYLLVERWTARSRSRKRQPTI